MLKFLESIIKNTIKKVEVGICQMGLICLFTKIIEPLILQLGDSEQPFSGCSAHSYNSFNAYTVRSSQWTALQWVGMECYTVKPIMRMQMEKQSECLENSFATFLRAFGMCLTTIMLEASHIRDRHYSCNVLEQDLAWKVDDSWHLLRLGILVRYLRFFLT